MARRLKFPQFNPDEYLPDCTERSEAVIMAMIEKGCPLVANYGAGVNSTAMIVEFARRGLRPDATLFADTGNEHEPTLEYLSLFGEWLSKHGLAVTTVSNAGQHASLEAECLTNKTLPSLAFGFRGCSVKWKRQPMDRWLKAWPKAIEAWESGLQVIRCIGIHAGELHRGKVPDTKGFVYWRPMVDWNLYQDDCVRIIEAAGLPVPRKSSCWFCPAKKKYEILELAQSRPDLFARCVELEHNAAPNLRSTKGLGRNWSWESFVASQVKDEYPEQPEQSCIWCDDGSCPKDDEP